MPELPEVETIRRQIAPHIEGRRIEQLDVLDARWCEPAEPSALEDAVRGRRIERVARRASTWFWSWRTRSTWRCTCE